MGSSQADGHADDDPFDHGRRVAAHVVSLTRQFNDEEILVAVEALGIFLHHLWATSLEGIDVSFEDYAAEIGHTLGQMHARAMVHRRATPGDEHGTN